MTHQLYTKAHLQLARQGVLGRPALCQLGLQRADAARLVAGFLARGRRCLGGRRLCSRLGKDS